MSDNIFREKSLKRISSPESLNDYVKVSNPGVWVLLVATIVLLLGFLAWGVFGKIDSKIETVGVVNNGVLTVYVKEDDMDSVNDSSIISIDDDEFSVSSISNTPLKLDYSFNDSYLHIADMDKDSWVCKLSSKVSLSDGVYKVNVVTERIKPISLLFN